MKTSDYIFTCEHGGNDVPQDFLDVFTGNEEILQSHRGWDPGAREIAEYLARELQAPVFCASVTRLLIEFNRSLHHAQLFSEFSNGLDAERKALLLGVYNRYRQQVVDMIDRRHKEGRRTVHISVHSFTPVLDGQTREADIGILFDPDREEERGFCERLRQELEEALPAFRIRYNYPYLGTDDGFTTFLRQRYPDRYIGVELEINQEYVGREEMEEIKIMLAGALNF